MFLATQKDLPKRSKIPIQLKQTLLANKTSSQQVKIFIDKYIECQKSEFGALILTIVSYKTK